MQRYLERLFIKPEPVTIILLTVIYLGARLVNLLSLPRFNDEALEILRGLQHDVSGALFGGKLLASLIWSLAPSVSVEPLLFARVVSVIAGLLTAIVIVQIGAVLSSFRVGLLAAACTPFILTRCSTTGSPRPTTSRCCSARS